MNILFIVKLKSLHTIIQILLRYYVGALFTRNDSRLMARIRICRHDSY